MYLVINKCVTAVKVSNFSGHYLRNRSSLDIGVLGYIGIVQHKEHSPEVLSIPSGTPVCIYTQSAKKIYTHFKKGKNLRSSNENRASAIFFDCPACCMVTLAFM